MTLNDWIDRNSGLTLKVPAGTDTRIYVGDPMLPQDAHVTITINHAELRTMIGKALKNRSRRSRDGALTVKVER